MQTLTHRERNWFVETKGKRIIFLAKCLITYFLTLFPLAKKVSHKTTEKG